MEGSARDLLAEAETTEGPEERDAVGEAEDWLGKLLNDGPVGSKEIPTAAKQSGIAWRTVERAKTRLRVKSRKAGLCGLAVVRVPPKTVKVRKKMKALAVLAQTQAWRGFPGIVKSKTAKTANVLGIVRARRVIPAR